MKTNQKHGCYVTKSQIEELVIKLVKEKYNQEVCGLFTDYQYDTFQISR